LIKDGFKHDIGLRYHQMMSVKTALISVYDKTGVVDFARELTQLGIEIIATRGTFDVLKKGGVQLVKHVSDVTKFPEILDGRVKTEHPKLIAGILALRNKKEHLDELIKLEVQPVDMVVCNLYPLEKLASNGASLKTFVDNIDIGGPNLIRAAAKNFEDVVVIVNPSKYHQISQELKKGNVSLRTKSMLAIAAYKETAKYDYTIWKFLKNAIKNS